MLTNLQGSRALSLIHWNRGFQCFELKLTHLLGFEQPDEDENRERRYVVRTLRYLNIQVQEAYVIMRCCRSMAFRRAGRSKFRRRSPHKQ